MALFQLRRLTGGSSLRNGDSLRAGAAAPPPGGSHPVSLLTKLAAYSAPKGRYIGASPLPPGDPPPAGGPHPVPRLTKLGPAGIPQSYTSIAPHLEGGAHPVGRLTRLGAHGVPQAFTIGSTTPPVVGGPHPVPRLTVLGPAGLPKRPYTFVAPIFSDVFGEGAGTLSLVSATANGVQDMAGRASGTFELIGTVVAPGFGIAPGVLVQVRRARPRVYRVPARPRHG